MSTGLGALGILVEVGAAVDGGLTGSLGTRTSGRNGLTKLQSSPVSTEPHDAQQPPQLISLHSVKMNQFGGSPLRDVQDMKHDSCYSNTPMSATCAVQVDDQLTRRIRLQEVFHLLHEFLHDAVSCKAPHNPGTPANMSSKSLVIVTVMEMPAIDLQHCDAIQSWLSIGPPCSRCHYQDVRAIQSPQGLVQSGLNSRSARMVKSSGSLGGIHRRGGV